MFRLAALVIIIAQLLSADDDVSFLRRTFAEPPDDARVMMRWWWFGPAVTHSELEREMRAMKSGGIGGFEVQPVYPLALDNPGTGLRNVRFLSPEFLEALQFTARKTKELGLRFDLTLGSGWPFGGPSVPLAEAAGRLRIETLHATGETHLPVLRDGESLIAVFGPDNKEIQPARSGTVTASGDVLVFIASHTRQAVKRAAYGAEGYVLDHYSSQATADYLKNVGEPLVTAVKDNPPHAIFCDSLEVYGSDWTPDLLDQFRQKRGYDLRPYLPALVKDIGPSTAGVRHDWGLTLTEVFQDRFLRPLHAFARSHGSLLRMQDYGIPPAIISSNALIDLPEGEGSQWKVVRASRWASSASHIYGKPATSSETWTWLHSPVFRATPLDMKAEADIHFIEGITQLTGHGWPYTAEGIEYPGWRFYASAVFDDKNPWWIVMPDVTRDLQRVSWLLRRGEAQNDVALYMPNADVWSAFRAGKVHMIEQLRDHVGPLIMPRVLDAGFGLDFIDDPAIRDAHVLSGTSRYRIVVLPGVRTIPVESMRALETFKKAGGLVVAVRAVPSLAPGLNATAADHAKVREIASRLFPDGAVAESNLDAALRKARQPEIQLSKAIPDIGFAHRRVADMEIFFVANTSNVRQNADAVFRVSGASSAEEWNAMSGATSAIAARPAKNGLLIPLQLEPYESRVFVFHRGATLRKEQRDRELSESVAVQGPWTVSFGNEGPTVQMRTLASWTEDDRTRFYSGVATYETQVAVTETAAASHSVVLDFGEGSPVPIPTGGGKSAGPGMQTWLDGPVREAALVFVNGKRAGSVWCPPYQVDVTGLLHPGTNTLRIEVANLAVNYLAGHPLPDYKELRAKYGNRFDPQDMDKIRPEPSGLLHPPTIRFSR